jgi:chemotaxis protein CheD
MFWNHCSVPETTRWLALSWFFPSRPRKKNETNMTNHEKVMQEKETFVVGIGEIVVSALPHAVITCIGLGSCVAVCAYDELAKVGGMAHVVLPHSARSRGGNPAKYADTAVPLLVEELGKIGGVRDRLIVKVAGGAQMGTITGMKDVFQTGEKNTAQIMAALEKEKIPLAAADIGGTLGRMVKMYLDTGKVTIKTVNGIIKEL